MMVGRERELARLSEQLVEALAARGGLVLLAGKAGIGKTTLLEELGREAQARGAQVLAGASSTLLEPAPLGVWAGLRVWLLALADVHRATGQAVPLWAVLVEAQQLCSSLKAAPALARAEALASRVAAPRLPARLSTREVEVLRLVAGGHTNREIARTLVLSERTVPVHIRNILTKTRSANRAAAAVFALRHGIA